KVPPLLQRYLKKTKLVVLKAISLILALSINFVLKNIFMVKKSHLILILMTIISNTLLSSAQEKISFEISFKEPQTHYAEVKMEITGNKEKVIDVKMPVWAPGSYLIREFPKNVEGFYATGNGKELISNKIN